MVTNRSLRGVPEQIFYAYAENIIDADEFSLLYDASQSKESIDDEQSFINFRFGNNDLYTFWMFLIYPTE